MCKTDRRFFKKLLEPNFNELMQTVSASLFNSTFNPYTVVLCNIARKWKWTSKCSNNAIKNNINGNCNHSLILVLKMTQKKSSNQMFTQTFLTLWPSHGAVKMHVPTESRLSWKPKRIFCIVNRSIQSLNTTVPCREWPLNYAQIACNRTVITVKFMCSLQST